MWKNFIVLLHIVAISFVALPKSYLHDCHSSHVSKIDKHNSFEQACEACDHFFAQVFTAPEAGFQLVTYENSTSFVENSGNQEVNAVEVEKTSRGPPFLLR